MGLAIAYAAIKLIRVSFERVIWIRNVPNPAASGALWTNRATEIKRPTPSPPDDPPCE